MGRIEAIARALNTLKKAGYKTLHGDDNDEGFARRHLDRDKCIGDTKEKVFASLSGRNRLSEAWRQKAVHDEAYQEFLASQQQQQQQQQPQQELLHQQPREPHAEQDDDQPSPPVLQELLCSLDSALAEARPRRPHRNSVTAYTIDLYGNGDGARCGSGFGCGSGSFGRSLTTSVVSSHGSAGSPSASPFTTEEGLSGGGGDGGGSSRGRVPSSSGVVSCSGGGAGGGGSRLPQLSPLGDVTRARSSLEVAFTRAGASCGIAGLAEGGQGGQEDDSDDCDDLVNVLGRGFGGVAQRSGSAVLHAGAVPPLGPRPSAAAASGGTGLRLPALRQNSHPFHEGAPPAGAGGGGGGAGGGGGGAGGIAAGPSFRILKSMTSTSASASASASASSTGALHSCVASGGAGAGALSPTLSRQSTPTGMSAAFDSVRQPQRLAAAGDGAAAVEDAAVTAYGGRMSPAPPSSNEPQLGTPRRRQVSVTGIVQVAAPSAGGGGGGGRTSGGARQLSRPASMCRSRTTSSRALLGGGDVDGRGGGAAAAVPGISRRGSLATLGAQEEGIALDITDDVGRWFDAGDLLYCNTDCPEEMAHILDELARSAGRAPSGGGHSANGGVAAADGGSGRGGRLGGGSSSGRPFVVPVPPRGSASGSRAVSRTASGGEPHAAADGALPELGGGGMCGGAATSPGWPRRGCVGGCGSGGGAAAAAACAAGGGGRGSCSGGVRGSDTLLPRLPAPAGVTAPGAAGAVVRQGSNRRRSCHVPEQEYSRVLAEAANGGGGDGGGTGAGAGSSSGGGGRLALQSQRRSSQLLIQAAGRRASMVVVPQQ